LFLGLSVGVGHEVRAVEADVEGIPGHECARGVVDDGQDDGVDFEKSTIPGLTL